MPTDRQFLGFDAYKKAMDCLKPGDIAIFATPLAFRWVHFTYAIEKGLNVFMEKPLTADGPTSRKMFKLAEEAKAKNLKVGVGLMSRHSRPMQQLADRIHGGEIGDIILMRGYRMHGPVGFDAIAAQAGRYYRSGLSDPPLPQLPLGQRRLLQRFLHPHHRPMLLDEECLAGPGPGDRRPALSRRRTSIRTSTSTASNTPLPTGRKLFLDGRCMTGCTEIYTSYAHGTKGDGHDLRMTATSDSPRPFTRASASTGHDLGIARSRPTRRNPYQNEWDDLSTPSATTSPTTK